MFDGEGGGGSNPKKVSSKAVTSKIISSEHPKIIL